MGFFPSASGGPDIDKLLVGSLHAPMLDELMVSMVMKAEMVAVANEIKSRWVAKVEKRTGNLASTARVSAHHSKSRDRRWEAEFSAGGPRASYAPEVEAEGHALAQVLHDMGYATGFTDRVGPTAHTRDRPRRLSSDRSLSTAKSTGEAEAIRRAAPDQPVQKQEAMKQDARQAAPRRTTRIVSERRAPGNYIVTAGERKYRIERLRTDTPGYGVEHRWWISPGDMGTEEPLLDPTRTKAEALYEIRLLVERLEQEDDE